MGESVAQLRKRAQRPGSPSRSEAATESTLTHHPNQFFDPPASGSGAASSPVRSKKEIAMAKRTAKRRQNVREGVLNVQEFQREDRRTRNLQVLDGGWQPANDGGRDQAFVKNVRPKSKGQTALMEAIDAHSLVLALGPAGTGKTYLAIAKAVEALESGKVGRIVLSRPAVEAGESLGYLPGAMEDKLAPYLRPLYDALTDRLSAKRLKALMAEGLIEIAPVGFMRGRTLNNAFVVIDEAQNCTYGQIKMLLTRLGWHSTMVVTGDPAQTDLLPDLSGLHAVADKLESVENIAVVRLGDVDIVRHPLVASMLGVL
ncbi:phosphate starvation-inducible protein PhoH [alpha proteobacterium U9-1i]|nr:phosphate starvation-inducible protein PhoH [alpha proteobacterium U9-1i]